MLFCSREQHFSVSLRFLIMLLHSLFTFVTTHKRRRFFFSLAHDGCFLPVPTDLFYGIYERKEEGRNIF